MIESSTIAALSTPIGEGGIGIIRLSGPQALSIAARIFEVSGGQHLPDLPSHTIHHGYVHGFNEDDLLDEALLLIMKGPRSYTGEDVIEIHGHGGQTTTASILEAAIAAGARLAEPGEFTRRAFLNGRLDLAQAEAVIDLIRAKTKVAQKIALTQLSGGLSRKVLFLKNDLMTLVAAVEVSLDFDEEEYDEMPRTMLLNRIEGLAGRTDKLLQESLEGALYREGLRVVIAGRPNVGKSSLLNALLEEKRAIVTPVPGTTRDTIEEFINLKGIPLKIVDCAGIQEARCEIEMEGVRRSVKELMSSPIAILVLDSSDGIHPEDLKIFEMIRDKKALVVINKTDLPEKIADKEVKKYFTGLSVIRLSCATAEGLEEFKEALYQTATRDIAISGKPGFTANLRQRDVLRRTAGFLNSAAEAGRGGMALDALASDLRLGLETLGEITGETAAADILDAIFKNFCIGK